MSYDDFEDERPERAAQIKAELKTARPEDFQVVKLENQGGEVTWAASLYGSMDIAWFRRKQDCEKFIRHWSKS